MLKRLLIALLVASSTFFACAKRFPKTSEIMGYTTTVHITDRRNITQIQATQTFEAPTRQELTEKVITFITSTCTGKQDLRITFISKIHTIKRTLKERSRSLIWCKKRLGRSSLRCKENTEIQTNRSLKKVQAALQASFGNTPGDILGIYLKGMLWYIVSACVFELLARIIILY